MALFKNQVSYAGVAETEQAMQMLDDASKPMEAMSIFQQKADRLDKSKKIRYDIRANNPKIKAITDSRTIFTIGMQSLDKVRLHLLLWCLRTKTLSISQTPNGFTCKDGMLLFYNHPIADMAMVEEF